jgi:GTP-binding protein Era
MKSGFVAILGRPNVGKSTFLNAILSKKVSITSPKAQTTRDNIEGILTEKDYQMVFVDTPGIFDSGEALDKYMNKEARGSLVSADVALYLISATELDVDADELIIDSLKIKCPLFLVVNKIDLATAPMVEALLTRLALKYPNTKILQMSALTNFGLKEVKEAIAGVLKEGPAYFPAEEITDKDKTFVAKETIRQELLHFLKDEVPHQSAVTIDEFKEKNDSVKIEATIYVEKKTQLGIVVGKNGSMIKKISMTARHELEKQWHEHVTLLVFARYEPEWRNKPDKLKAFGYSNNERDN